MTRAQRVLGVLGVLCAALLLSACVHSKAQSDVGDRIRGTWYDSKTGGEYQFISDSLLVVPHAQSGGGNAVSYRILNDEELDIVAGGSHHVSIIAGVTADRLTLEDPITHMPQHFYRSIAKTKFIKSIEASAHAALSSFATATADPTTVWVGFEPTGKGTDWTTWSPTTLNTYGTAWQWTDLRRDKTPAKVWGGGDSRGYSFSFTRKLPTAAELAKVAADTSIEASAGMSTIDVGYSEAMKKYVAGTMVYLPGGLVYSLGDGFAIGVAVDPKGETFVPRTHN